MINISSAARQAMQSDAVQYIKIKVEPLTGDPFTITDADITQGGMKIETHTLDGEELEIGNMNAAVLDLTLDNESGKFNGVRFAGAHLTVFVGVDVNETVEHMPLGVFTVDEQPHLWSTVSLAAYDNMVQMDIPYKPSTVFPNSLRNLVRECVEQSGLICYDYSMFPDEYIITVPPSGDNLTYRQVAMWCCQCACVNGCADENGNVKFAFYRKYTPEAVQTENGESLELENGDILLANGVGDVHYHLKASERFISNMMIEEEDVMITGNRFTDDEDNIYPTDVNTEYCIETTGNGVFNAMTVEGKIATAAAVDEAIRGFTYRAFTAEIVSLPFLQAGDSIAYHDENGLYQTFITNWEYNPNGKMSISAKAKSLREKGYAPLGSLTPGQKAIIEQVNKNVEKTRAELTDRETALLLFNEQMFNSMGLYKTVKDSENGGVIVYYHDKTELENSGTIYMFGASGFAWTTDGWNDGEPLWNYGFTGAGDAILNTIHAYMISADLIKTGLLQSRNGASWINMDDGTFCFRAVKDAWMDVDTGEMSYQYENKLLLNEKNELLINGKIVNGSGADIIWYIENTSSTTGITHKRLEIGDISDLDSVYISASSDVWLFAKEVRANATTLATTSDERLKSNVKAISSDARFLSFFDNLTPFLFKYTEGNSGRTHMGLIAQQVEQAAIKSGLDINDIAAYVKSDAHRDDLEGYELALRYDEFVGLIIAKVQAQEKIISDLKKRISVLEEKMSKL